MPAKRYSVADFRELVTACRDLGVTHVELEGMKFVLGPRPAEGERKRMTPEELAEAKRAKRDAVMFAHTSMRPVRRP